MNYTNWAAMLAVFTTPFWPWLLRKMVERLFDRLEENTPPVQRTEHRVARQVKQPAVAEVDPEDAMRAELVHWTSQGLRKLGYSRDEAQRMADHIPADYKTMDDLQYALQYCLRGKGAKK